MPASKSSKAPLCCTMISPIVYHTHISTPKQQTPTPSHAEIHARLDMPSSFDLTATLVPATPSVCDSSHMSPPQSLLHVGTAPTQLRLRAGARPWFPLPIIPRLNTRSKPWITNESSPTSTPTHTPHPPLVLYLPDPLVTAASSMCHRFCTSPSINSVIRYLQHPIVRDFTSAYHPASALLDSYTTDVLLVSVGDSWHMLSYLATIATEPHKSTLAKDSVHFVREEILERTKRGFSIILTKDDALTYFGASLALHRRTKRTGNLASFATPLRLPTTSLPPSTLPPTPP